MFDFIPWFDDAYIVEMGRLFFCGGDDYSILTSRNETVMIPIHYIGPCLQDIFFRLSGAVGVRLSPFIGLCATWYFFRRWIIKSWNFPRPTTELLALLAFTAPLPFQSVIGGRIDTWLFACTFAAMACLGKPDCKRSLLQLSSAAFLAALSFYLWPSAIMLTPLYPAFCFNLNRKREFIIFCLAGVGSALILALPLLPNLNIVIEAFNRHIEDSASPTMSAFAIADNLIRETLRAPFHTALAGIGLVSWFCRKKFVAIATFASIFTFCVLTRFYTYRIIYLVPFALLMCLDAADLLRHRWPRFNFGFLLIAAVCGLACGPIGSLFLSYPKLPDNLKQSLANEIGTGPIRVFNPDFAVYYIGRELNWRQIAFSSPNDSDDPKMLKDALDRSDFVVLRDYDYRPIQISCSPYSLLCSAILNAAEKERSVPSDEKSWMAKLGERSKTLLHGPLKLDGFKEISCHGTIRVFCKTNAYSQTKTQRQEQPK